MQRHGRATTTPPRTPAASATHGAETPFCFSKGREKKEHIDWRLLCSLDVERVRNETDIPALQSVVDMVAFCDLGGKDFRHTDANTLRLLGLAQLIIEYLLHCQSVLATSENELRSNAAENEEVADKIRQRCEKQSQEIASLRRERRLLKKSLFAYQLMARYPATTSHHHRAPSATRSGAARSRRRSSSRTHDDSEANMNTKNEDLESNYEPDDEHERRQEQRRRHRYDYEYDFEYDAPARSAPALSPSKICRYCPKAFRSLDYLESHLRRRHPDSQNYVREEFYYCPSSCSHVCYQQQPSCCAHGPAVPNNQAHLQNLQSPLAMQQQSPAANTSSTASMNTSGQKRHREIVSKLSTTMEELSQRLIETELKLKSDMESRMQAELEEKSKVISEQMQRDLAARMSEIDAMRIGLCAEVAAERASIAKERSMLDSLRREMLEIQRAQQAEAETRITSAAAAAAASAAAASAAAAIASASSPQTPAALPKTPSPSPLASPLGQLEDDDHSSCQQSPQPPPPLPVHRISKDNSTSTDSVNKESEKQALLTTPTVNPGLDIAARLAESQESTLRAVRQIVAEEIGALGKQISTPVAETQQISLPRQKPPSGLRIVTGASHESENFENMDTESVVTEKFTLPKKSPKRLSAAPSELSQPRVDSANDRTANFQPLGDDTEFNSPGSPTPADPASEWPRISRHLSSHRCVSLPHVPWVRSALPHPAMHVLRAREQEKDHLRRSFAALAASKGVAEDIALLNPDTMQSLVQQFEAQRDQRVTNDACYMYMYDYLCDEIEQISAQHFKFKPKPVLSRLPAAHLRRATHVYDSNNANNADAHVAARTQRMRSMSTGAISTAANATPSSVPASARAAYPIYSATTLQQQQQHFKKQTASPVAVRQRVLSASDRRASLIGRHVDWRLPLAVETNQASSSSSASIAGGMMHARSGSMPNKRTYEENGRSSFSQAGSFGILQSPPSAFPRRLATSIANNQDTSSNVPISAASAVSGGMTAAPQSSIPASYVIQNDWSRRLSAAASKPTPRLAYLRATNPDETPVAEEHQRDSMDVAAKRHVTENTYNNNDLPPAPYSYQFSPAPVPSPLTQQHNGVTAQSLVSQQQQQHQDLSDDDDSSIDSQTFDNTARSKQPQYVTKPATMAIPEPTPTATTAAAQHASAATTLQQPVAQSAASNLSDWDVESL